MPLPDSAFPALPHVPDPHQLLVDDPAFTFSSSCGGRGGLAGLRAWQTADAGCLAIVTERGLGVSITNAAEEITAALTARLPGPLVVLEHWLPGDGADHHRLDQVLAAADRRPQWRRIWPTPPTNPHHASCETWMNTCGHALLAARAS
ncbi:hypothetical protein [Streptomyces marianii]|uniref:Uncharacterized protein n=1 Tax=Streptomyces marianii TaxID=1817406 RepID=A0A5R9DTV9_9ACTN|nr:hypothetical protein [Streptomyces marianii]TLQ39194.1 hypothetical protein FEF34_37980 [Streptomyces marianii]